MSKSNIADYQKLVNLFTEFNIPFTQTEDGNKMIRLNTEALEDDSIVLGKDGFCTCFEFTTSGKFVNIGIWEER